MKRSWVKSALVPMALVLVWLTGGCAELRLEDEFYRAIVGQSLDEATVAAGLKEALQVGSDRAVQSLSAVDGYLANELIRINLPEEYQEVARTLRKIGLGGEMDRLEIKMNRAAEKAAAEAREVLVDAVQEMTIQDALGILGGKDTAATEYFQLKTTERLHQRFDPIIRQKMGEVGFMDLYNEVTGIYNALPFIQKPALDLEDYVIQESLNGIFTSLAEEERAIRRDPVKRTTELLRKVFG